MDPSQTRLMLVLSGLVLVVALALGQSKPEDRGDPDATELLWKVSEAEVQRVVVERASDTLTFERRGEEFTLKGPREGLADPDRTHELLDALSELRFGTPLTSSDAPPEELGLGRPPQARVAVTLRDGSEHRLEIGRPSPVGWRNYVRAPSGVVVVADGQVGELLVEPALSFYDHRVFQFEVAQVQRVVVESPEGTLDLHGEGKRWWSEGFTRADVVAVENLLLTLKDFRFVALEDPGEPVEEPLFRVDVHLSEGQVQSLRIGERVEEGLRAERVGGARGALLPQTVSQLLQGPSDVGDRRAFPLDPEATDRVVVVSPGGRFEATRQGSSWQVGGSEDGAAWDRVQALSRAAIHYRLTELPPLVPEGEVRWWTGAEEALVILGQRLPNGDRLAQDAAGGGVYRVLAADLAAAGLDWGEVALPEAG